MAGTKRRPIERHAHAVVTDRAVALFRMLLKHDEGSPEHGQAEAELHRELALKPWNYFVSWVSADSVPSPDMDRRSRADFERAVALRCELERLVKLTPHPRKRAVRKVVQSPPVQPIADCPGSE
jgi:hypothetical protein